MARWRLIGLVSVAIWVAGWVAPASLYADSYTLEDVKLKTAGELVDMCTVDPQHEHYAVALAFCYGFFEGTIRYDEAIAGTKDHMQLVCAPAGTTRSQAVEVFVSYMKENSQYQSEAPVDAIYRALIPKWPCPK
jgi:Rap1a immunity proteins